MGQVQIGSLIRAIGHPSRHVDDCFNYIGILVTGGGGGIYIYIYTHIIQGVVIYDYI